MGYIDRDFDGGAYHYARANGSLGVFYTTASYNTAGVGSPVAQLVDIYHREVVHVLSGNYIISYKRATPHSASVTANVWRWHTINPMTAVGAAYKNDSGTGRLFYRLMQSSNTPSYVFKQSTDYGSTAYRAEVTMPMSAPVWALEVFQVSTTSTPAMQAMSEVPKAGVGLPVNSTCRGLTIEETVFKHFLFSTSTDGSPNTFLGPLYYVQKNGSDDIHRVFNLKPGQQYLVTETVQSGSYYKYVLSESFGTGFTANSDGIIEFTPAQIGAPGTNYYNIDINDYTITNSDSIVTASATYNVGVADDATTNSGDSVDVGKNATVYSENIVHDATTNSGDDVSLTDKIAINDSGGTTADVVDVQRIGSPPIVEVEKRIDGPITSILPNGDLSVQFFSSEPDDGTFYTKLDDADDADFVRCIPTPVVQLANLRFSLTDATATVSTIRSMQVGVRVRNGTFVAIKNPYLRIDIYRDATLATRVLGYNLPLFSTDTATWVRTPVIPVLVEPQNVANMVIQIRPKADDYVNFGSYGLEISGLLVDVSGDAKEKAI